MKKGSLHDIGLQCYISYLKPNSSLSSYYKSQKITDKLILTYSGVCVEAH